MRSTASSKPSAVRLQWAHASPRTRIQVLAAALLVLGTASVLFESAVFRNLQRDGRFALLPSGGLLSAETAEIDPQVPPASVIEARTVIVLPERETETPVTDPPTPAPAPALSTMPAFASPIERKCFHERDLGLIPAIRNNTRDFCVRTASENAVNVDATRRTQVTFVDLAASGSLSMRAMVFHHDFKLDFTQTKISRPIASLAQDGGDHDPRFKWLPSMISCGCNEFQEFAAAFYRASGNRTTLRPWDPTLAGTYETIEEPSTVCGVAAEIPSTTVPPAEASAPPLVISEKTIMITRRDDHNPFFQVSSALNAWLMARSLGWSRDETRVIHMDGGYPSPIDELHYHLLSTPTKFSLLRGRENLMGLKLHFTNQVMIAPYETTGPMMQHLDDFEPCQRSQLIQEFREEALSSMGVEAVDLAVKSQITVTIITRRNYRGRRVARKLLNEDELLAAMRANYTSHNGLPIVFQAIEFVDVTLAQQMDITLNSDVVIGMHGAGMVNVLWTKPETLVIEIFPRRRFRWGYRNICQYVGCDWHEFRGGKDTGNGDNASDKTIPVGQWLAFFDPLFRRQIGMPATSAPPMVAATPTPAPTAASTMASAPTLWKVVVKDQPAGATQPKAGSDTVTGRALRSGFAQA